MLGACKVTVPTTRDPNAFHWTMQYPLYNHVIKVEAKELFVAPDVWASHALNSGRSVINKKYSNGATVIQSTVSTISSFNDRVIEHKATIHDAGHQYSGFFEGTRVNFRKRADVLYTIKDVSTVANMLCPVCSYPVVKCKFPNEHLIGPDGPTQSEVFEFFNDIYAEADNIALEELSNLSSEDKNEKINDLMYEIESELYAISDKSVFADFLSNTRIFLSESERTKYLDQLSPSLRNKILLYLQDAHLKQEIEFKVSELQTAETTVREKLNISTQITPVVNFLMEKQEEERYAEFSSIIGKLSGKFSRLSETELSVTNYPNPFNPETTIVYQLEKAAVVDLIIFNSLGQKLKTLVNNQYQSASKYSVVWDGRNESGEKLASGIYFYKLKVANNLITKKMVLMK